MNVPTAPAPLDEAGLAIEETKRLIGLGATKMSFDEGQITLARAFFNMLKIIQDFMESGRSVADSAFITRFGRQIALGADEMDKLQVTDLELKSSTLSPELQKVLTGADGTFAYLTRMEAEATLVRKCKAAQDKAGETSKTAAYFAFVDALEEYMAVREKLQQAEEKEGVIMPEDDRDDMKMTYLRGLNPQIALARAARPNIDLNDYEGHKSNGLDAKYATGYGSIAAVVRFVSSLNPVAKLMGTWDPSKVKSEHGLYGAICASSTPSASKCSLKPDCGTHAVAVEEEKKRNGGVQGPK